MWRALDLAISNAESQLEKTSKDVNEVRNRFREQRRVLSSLQFQRDRLPDFNNVGEPQSNIFPRICFSMLVDILSFSVFHLLMPILPKPVSITFFPPGHPTTRCVTTMPGVKAVILIGDLAQKTRAWECVGCVYLMVSPILQLRLRGSPPAIYSHRTRCTVIFHLLANQVLPENVMAITRN
jgi:hypothetical protein